MRTYFGKDMEAHGGGGDFKGLISATINDLCVAVCILGLWC